VAPGILVQVPSKVAGEEGIAVRVLTPRRSRYPEGAPVVVHVPGGVGPGAAAGPPEFAGLGFVELYFAFPGGGRGEAASGGVYDFRGPRSCRALADVLRFATGRARDRRGRTLEDLVRPVRVLKRNCGLIGASNGGNACGLVMARHGKQFPDLAFYVSMESPYGEGAVAAELGSHESGLNPAYDPATGVLDLSRLAWSPDLAPAVFPPAGRPEADLRGALFFDLNGDERYTRDADFPAHVVVADPGRGLRAWYSPRLLQEAKRRALIGKRRPDHIPTLDEAKRFWRDRDAAGSVAQAVNKCRNLAVIVYAGARDHVQVAPDHPHILAQVEGFHRAGARFVRLNPDRSYVEQIVAAGPRPFRQAAVSFADNDAGKAFDRRSIHDALEPEGLPVPRYIQAAVCEAADRVQAGNWRPDLASVLYPDAPRLPPPMPAGGPGERDLMARRGAAGNDFAAEELFQAAAGVPSVIRDAKGRLIAAFQWFPERPSPHFDRVAVRISTDGGRSWGKPEPIEIDGLPRSYTRPFDPTLALLPDGRIRLYFSSNPTGRRILDENTATYSAVSRDGVRYSFEPGARFTVPGRIVIDCAVLRLGDQWHYYAPIGRPEDGAYHAVSKDGLTFTRQADIASVEGVNWTGNLVAYGDGMRFYGSSRRGLWWAFSRDGEQWTRPRYLSVRGGDPAVVAVSEKEYLLVYVSEPRRPPPPPAPGPQPPRRSPRRG
jgi:hypothetical protein